MANSNLPDAPFQYIFDAFVDLVLGERPAVELHHFVVHGYSSLLPYQSSQLGRIIVLDNYLPPGARKDFLDELDGKRVHVAYLEEVRFNPISPKIIHRIKYSSLGRPPTDQCYRRNPGAVKCSLLRVWNYFACKLNLPHSFCHHLHPYLCRLSYVSVLVMLVPRGPEDSPLLSRYGSGGDS